MFKSQITLKTDAFGRIEKGNFTFEDGKQIQAICRTYTKTFPINLLALFLANNEKRAIKRLQKNACSDYFPKLIKESRSSHIRTYIEGDSMHRVKEKLSQQYFTECKRLITHMRKMGVANNDLAKEANWLVTPDKKPAISDFQLAVCFKRKNKFFLSLCQEDLRHLLKHKRKYLSCTHQEKNFLKKKSIFTKIWMATGKKIYHFITRKLLGWKERSGPEERDF